MARFQGQKKKAAFTPQSKKIEEKKAIFEEKPDDDEDDEDDDEEDEFDMEGDSAIDDDDIDEEEEEEEDDDDDDDDDDDEEEEEGSEGDVKEINKNQSISKTPITQQKTPVNNKQGNSAPVNKKATPKNAAKPKLIDTPRPNFGKKDNNSTPGNAPPQTKANKANISPQGNTQNSAKKDNKANTTTPGKAPNIAKKDNKANVSKPGKTPQNEPKTAKRPAEAQSPNAKKLKLDTEYNLKELDRINARDRRSLFIKGFPPTTAINEIKTLSKDIIDVRKTKAMAKYAYLEFKSEEIAEKNYQLLQSKTLKGNELQVDYVGVKSKHVKANKQMSRSINKLKLYINGFPANTTVQELKKVFPKAVEAIIPKRKKDMSCTYGFVKFEKEEDAADAHDKATNLVINGKLVTVLYALNRENQKEVKEKAPSQKTNVNKKAPKTPAQSKKNNSKKVEEEKDDDDAEMDDDEEDDIEMGDEEEEEDDDDDEEEEDDDGEEEEDDDDDDDDDKDE